MRGEGSGPPWSISCLDSLLRSGCRAGRGKKGESVWVKCDQNGGANRSFGCKSPQSLSLSLISHLYEISVTYTTYITDYICFWQVLETFQLLGFFSAS